MKRWMLSLVIGIPLTSVLFGCLMFYFAFTSTDSDVLQGVPEQAAPLSKTSWRTPSEGERP